MGSRPKNLQKTIAQVLFLGAIVLLSIGYTAVNMLAAYRDRKLPPIEATYVGSFCNTSSVRTNKFGSTDRVNVPGSSEVLCLRRPFFYLVFPDPGDKVVVVRRYVDNGTQTGFRAAYYLDGWWWVWEMAVASLVLLPAIGIGLLLLYVRKLHRDRGSSH